MKRSWASDRDNLTRSLTRLGRHARATGETGNRNEDAPLLDVSGGKAEGRSPLWLLIFPEGTITSDEERAKSLKYAEREGIVSVHLAVLKQDDFVTTLHPRSTGLLFCLRTLLPQVPDLQLLDVTIGYPGVPVGKYPQD